MGKLILTRKPGESVKIGDSLVLTIREVHPAKVYVGFEGFVGPFRARAPEFVWMKLQGKIEIPGEHGETRVTIAAISGRQVRLHFEADNSVKIVRTELL